MVHLSSACEILSTIQSWWVAVPTERSSAEDYKLDFPTIWVQGPVLVEYGANLSHRYRRLAEYIQWGKLE
jgi:hypothetical protein